MELTTSSPPHRGRSRAGAWLALGAGSAVVVAAAVWVGSRPDAPAPPPARIPHTPNALEGTVTCNGEPLTAGSVVLWTPAGATNYSLIFPNGKYRIDNAPRGRVRLTVSARSGPPANLLPKTGETWPSELMRSPNVPVAPPVARRPPGADKSPPGKAPRPPQAAAPPTLPKPTADMQKLLADVDKKYAVPGADPAGPAIWCDTTGGPQTFDITLTVP